MELASPRQSRIKTAVISISCITGIAFSSYRLQTDVYNPGASVRGEPMAVVEQCDENTRRKHSSSFVWAPVSPGTPLYRKDSIKIGPGGSASIRMSDGSRLDLGENSLVIVEDLKERALAFARGSFVVRSDQGDKQISIGGDGKAVTRELSVRLLEPRSAARVFVHRGATARIVFAWESRVPASPFEGAPFLQFSSDSTFPSRATRDVFPPDARSHGITASLGPGRHYWRLAGPQGPISEARSLHIVVAEPLKPVFPDADGGVVTWSQETPIGFRWVARTAEPGVAASHRLEVARDPGFESPLTIDSVDAATGIALIRGLPLGRNFWRLRSTYGNTVVASAPVPFTISASAAPATEDRNR